MSDAFYKTICTGSSVAFATSSRGLVIGLGNVPRKGGVILAPNHASWYDVPLLAYHTSRMLDFVGTDELFRHPFWARFYSGMNVIRHNRDAPDSRAAVTILGRLRKERAIALFPEGKLCPYDQSLFTGGVLRPGMARLAMFAQVPVVPVVLINTSAYRRLRSWLPFRRARYGVIYGAPLSAPPMVRGRERSDVLRAFEETYRSRMRALRDVLLQETKMIACRDAEV